MKGEMSNEVYLSLIIVSDGHSKWPAGTAVLSQTTVGVYREDTQIL